MLQSVVLPNGTAWTFEYNSSDVGDPAGTNYGDLTKVTFPTGGTLTYTYANNLSCSSIRGVATRTLDANDGTGPHTWRYSYDYLHSSTTVTDPLGNDTVHTFTNLGGTCGVFENATQWYQGPQSGGNVLRSSSAQYSNSFLGIYPEPAGVYNVLRTQETTTWRDGKTSQENYTYDQSATTATGHVLSFGERTDASEYDFGSGAPGALLRQNATTYQAQVNSSYLNANLIDLPATSKVLDSAGNRCAETDYTHDEAAYLTGASISTQHVAPPQGFRGNASTVTHWLSNNVLNGSSCNAAASWSTFASHTNWFDTGEAYQDIDPLTHTTTYAYDPAYAGAYRTKTTNALGHITSGTYDFNTGLLTSFTDANATQQAVGNTPGDPNHTTFYFYDIMERLTGVTYPDGGHTSFDFNGDPVPPHITQSQTATPDPTIVHDNFYDGLGRITRAQLTSDPEGIDYTDTTYDPVGRMGKPGETGDRRDVF